MDNGLDKLNYNVGDTIEDLAVTFMDDKSGRNYINGKLNQFFFYTEKAIRYICKNAKIFAIERQFGVASYYTSILLPSFATIRFPRLPLLSLRIIMRYNGMLPSSPPLRLLFRSGMRWATNAMSHPIVGIFSTR